MKRVVWRTTSASRQTKSLFTTRTRRFYSNNNNNNESNNNDQAYTKRPRLYWYFIATSVASVAAVVGASQYYSRITPDELLPVTLEYNEETTKKAWSQISNLLYLRDLNYFKEEQFTLDFARRLIHFIDGCEYLVHDNVGMMQSTFNDVDPLYTSLLYVEKFLKFKNQHKEGTVIHNLIKSDLLPVLWNKLKDACDKKAQGVISFQDLDKIAQNKSVRGVSNEIELDDPVAEKIIEILTMLHSDPDFHDEITGQHEYIQAVYGSALRSHYQPIREISMKSIARLAESEIKHPYLCKTSIVNGHFVTNKFVKIPVKNASVEATALLQLLKASDTDRKNLLFIQPDDIHQGPCNTSTITLPNYVPKAITTTVLLVGYVATRWKFHYKIPFPLFKNAYFKKKVVPPLLLMGLYSSGLTTEYKRFSDSVFPYFTQKTENGVRIKSLQYFVFSGAMGLVDLTLWFWAYRYAKFVLLPSMIIWQN